MTVHLPELLLTGFIVVIVLSAHNLRRLGDGCGRLLERTFGKR